MRVRVLRLSTNVTEPAEWGRRFQDLTADASQMYARVLRRYNELLHRVAAGELQPDQIQKQFQDYLQERGTAATRELVELSVDLLAGLLYVQAKYREALLDGLLPADGPLPPPPSPSSIDLTNWFETLAKYATEQSARGMARQQRLVERIASGEITPAQIQEQGRRYLESQAPNFVGDVMDLGLTFVGRLQQSSAAMTEGLYDRVLGPESDESSPPDPPLVVDLRGASGSVVTAQIVVENTRGETADVRCGVSEFTPRAGGRPVQTVAEVVPARFTLGPGEARDVVLSLPLDRPSFTPGTDYFGILRISGTGEHEMVVQLIAHADPSAAPQQASARESTPPAQ